MKNLKGIPSKLTNKILWVKDSYRTHPSSFISGGYTLVLVHLNGKVYGYDKIKEPSLYVEEIIKNTNQVEKIYLDKYMICAYLKGTNDCSFQKIWDRHESNKGLIASLRSKEYNDEEYQWIRDNFDLAEDYYGAPVGLTAEEKEAWIDANEKDWD
ncbi:hypothetical protein VXP84_00255 [Acinetobacter oleivorans]|uniref:hypothetical protein n=1 Tax=Acinetobacter oleivorans TaxID=1148157 RepID=UPI003A84C637